MAGVSEYGYRTFKVNQAGGVVMDRFVALSDGGDDESAISYPTSGGRAVGVNKEDKDNGEYTAVMAMIGASTWVEWDNINGDPSPGDEVTTDANGRAIAIPVNATPIWYHVNGEILEINDNGTKKLAKIRLVSYRKQS